MKTHKRMWSSWRRGANDEETRGRNRLLPAGRSSQLNTHNNQQPDSVVTVASDDGLVTVQINRPQQRNALSLETLASLRGVFVACHGEPNLKCVVLTGAGDRSFAAGGDLKELLNYRTAVQAEHVARVGRDALDAIRDCPVPVYAAINGHALGGGAELALACDFRIAKADATLGFLQGKLSITTAWGGGADLLRLVGASRGLELLLTSRALDMPEALRCGLVDQLVADGEDLMGAVRAHAERFLAKPPHVIQAFARMAHAARSAQRAAEQPLELQNFVDTWTHDAHWTAAAAAVPKPKAGDEKP